MKLKKLNQLKRKRKLLSLKDVLQERITKEWDLTFFTIQMKTWKNHQRRNLNLDLNKWSLKKVSRFLNQEESVWESIIMNLHLQSNKASQKPKRKKKARKRRHISQKSPLQPINKGKRKRILQRFLVQQQTHQRSRFKPRKRRAVGKNQYMHKSLPTSKIQK